MNSFIESNSKRGADAFAIFLRKKNSETKKVIWYYLNLTETLQFQLFFHEFNVTDLADYYSDFCVDVSKQRLIYLFIYLVTYFAEEHSIYYYNEIVE